VAVIIGSDVTPEQQERLMSRRTRVILAFALLCMLGAAGLLHAGGLGTRAARWLVTGAEPRKADLLVVVAGGARERLVTAARLYYSGFAPMILVTGSKDPDKSEARHLVDWGIPVGVLVPAVVTSKSTLDDARCIREVIQSKGFRSILVVTSPYHTRRLGLILKRTLADLDVEVTVTASDSIYFDLGVWWTDPQGWHLIPTEYVKLGWAWVTVPKVAPVSHHVTGM